jgi:hypothetical protein
MMTMGASYLAHEGFTFVPLRHRAGRIRGRHAEGVHSHDASRHKPRAAFAASALRTAGQNFVRWVSYPRGKRRAGDSLGIATFH